MMKIIQVQNYKLETSCLEEKKHLSNTHNTLP